MYFFQNTDSGSPFHAGEQAVQRQLGVRDEIEPWARKAIRSYLPEQHRDFYATLPFVVLGARDTHGRPWATLLTGKPGFTHSPDPASLEIDARPSPGDALADSLHEGSDIGLLGIELATRRRNRVNGHLVAADARRLSLAVGQSFGNCPQYIRPRNWRWAREGGERPEAIRHDTLTPQLRAWIESADTLFIASGFALEGSTPEGQRSQRNDRTHGMDVSHRGGEPGFVTLKSERRLVFPDYAGNNFFNTIGNLLMDPRVGITFVDFSQARLLQLTGRATITTDRASSASDASPGPQRSIEVEIDELVELRQVLPLRFSDAGEGVRSLRLMHKVRASEDVTSFEFEARDGGALPDYKPGQHLPLELDIPGQPAPVSRTYTLSGSIKGRATVGSAPDAAPVSYRISVKREATGLASRFLHDTAEPGMFVNARAPAGDFTIADGRRPIVLVSAGVGITPMLSMLHGLVASGDPRAISFFHVARNGRQHALADEVRQVAARGAARVHISYSRPEAGDVMGRDYDAPGRLDGDRIAGVLPGLDADFYLCGPASFMAALQNDLERRGVDPDRMRSETFGPVGR